MKISQINQRRLYNFRKNKRGFVCFIIFIFIFVLSLFAEFIANDKPILVRYNNNFYIPVIKQYPETLFGGSFETEADYKDPYVIKLIQSKGWMLMPIIKYHYDTINYDLPVAAPSPPSADNLLGTDDQGRDVVARVIYGFRISILFALIFTFFSSLIGIIVGAIQGYFGGLVDLLFQRFIEIWSGLPVLFILMIMVSIITPSFWWLLLIMLAFKWTALVGVVRAEFLKARNCEYVTAARALGVTELVIVFRHILPNALVSSLTYIPFIITGSIITLTSLDFLGLGLPAGSPSLGELLSQGKMNLQDSWLGITAFCSLSTILTLVIFIGEAARDSIDPYK